MMRMLAWIDLLQTDGYVNRVLTFLHLISHPVNWLGGQSFTVVLGLVYGYIPYLILVLYAGLDRIDGALLEAGRDLGLGRVRTFLRVTLPLSRQAIMTGMLITVLPMLGDYFTNQLLSGTPGTAMIGNVIDPANTQALQGAGRGAVHAAAARPGHPDDLLRGGDQPARAGGGMTRHRELASAQPTARRHRGRPATGRTRLRRNPWRHAVVPRGVHLAVPDLVDRADRARRAVLVQQRQVAERVAGLLHALVLLATRSTPSCMTRRCTLAVIQTLRLSVYTTLIAVPLGVAFALGINRWRSCTARVASTS